MEQENIISTLNELEGNEAGIYFRNHLRQIIRLTLVDIMNEEVTALCGPKHTQNNPSEYKRAGSEDGLFYAEGRKQHIKRPRVRKDDQKVQLQSYEAARDPENISEEVFRSLSGGISTREFNKLKDGETVSKSEAARIWTSRAAAKLEELRSRDLSNDEYFCLMIDGIYMAKDVTALIALAINTEGEKILLDFAKYIRDRPFY